jgi:hypothetical protein
VVIVVSSGLAWLLRRFSSPTRYSLVLLFISFGFSWVQSARFLERYPESSFSKVEDVSNSVFEFQRTKKNTLVIIPDGYAGSDFTRLLRESPGFSPELEGFTFYHNTVARHGGTWGSVPEMLGGPAFRVTNLLGESRHWREVYKSAQDSLNAKLSAIGGGLDFVYGESVTGVSYYDRHSGFFKDAVDFAWLKLVPGFVRNRVYSGIKTRSDFEPKRKWDFLLRFLSKVEVGTSGTGRVKVLHVQVPHPSNFIPEGCRFDIVDTPTYVRADYHTEAGCFVRFLIALKKKLEAIGVYDNTEIIVVSDHGWEGRGTDFGQDMRGFGKDTYEGRSDPGILHPLLLVKPAGTRHAFEIDEKHFMVNTDVYPMICGTWNQCSPEVDPLSIKDRVHRFYITTPQFVLKHEYEVRNNLFESRNWRKIR